MNSLSFEQIQDSLNNWLGLILSERRTTTATAIILARCTRQQQEWVLEWVRILRRENLEMAYQFTLYVPKALALMDETAREDWANETLALYDKTDLSSALSHLQTVVNYAKTYQWKNAGLSLTEIQGILQIFLTGLNGRALKLVSSEITFTDTETLFVPATLNHFSQRKNNFRLYKAIIGHLWAQTWFGTWQRPLLTQITQFNHRDKAIRLFHTLERLRLDACLARELPGIHREMGHLLTLFNEQWIPSGWEDIAHHLMQPTTTVADSYQLLEIVSRWKVPKPVCYQGLLIPEHVESLIEQRQTHDKKAFQTELAQCPQNKNLFSNSSEQSTDSPNQSFSDTSNSSQNSSSSTADSIEKQISPNLFFEKEGISNNEKQIPQSPHFSKGGISKAEISTSILTLDGQPILPSEKLKKIIASIIQDNGSIPQDYLLSPEKGDNLAAIDSESETLQNPAKSQEPENKIFFYPEWDYRRGRYYKNWCVLREVAVPLQSEQFVTDTLQRYYGLLKTLRRTFEMLRGGYQRLKKQPFGEDIDLDALVATHAEAKHGLEMSQHVFTKMHKTARDIAVMLMVDMSGSTKGWVNQAERESLVLLCEILETLGDRYAIYGFSGMTHKRCDIYPIKHFNESYQKRVRQRISGIAPQEYTRMGVTIRHLTHLLKKIEAPIKLLITLSDGKPDDDDNYRGIYGIEDTRQALFEAKREGIHPFCITIDTEAKTYLSQMYGAVNYTVIDKVEQLPLRIADIYRKLTT